MDTPPARSCALPRDAASILELAARSMFDLFASASEGMLLVDREARVVWINDQYRRFLPALGFPREEDFVGHAVSDVVQNTQMHQVLRSGKPILIDLLSNRAGTFVVSRIPLRDDSGEVIGALRALSGPGPGLMPLVPRAEPLLGRFLSETRLFDPRYRNSAKARLGVTSRHVMMGGALALGGAMLWRHLDRKRRMRDGR
jgi:hypothetical protein